MTLTGIPVVSLIAACNMHDQYYIIPLLDEFRKRFPDIKVAYVVLDKGYDNEEIYRIIYDAYHIIPVIIRKKMVYPKGYSSEGSPNCSLGFTMNNAGIDYKRKRTKYCCRKKCRNSSQQLLKFCLT